MAPLVALVLVACGTTTDLVGSRAPDAGWVPASPDDVLETGLGVPHATTEQQIQNAYQQLFFGDSSSQAVYREVGPDAAYVEDVLHEDVRTDSIGYAMLVTVQLDEQVVFDKLWTWAKRYMLNSEPPRLGLLDWRCSTAGDDCYPVAATDATSVIATALFMGARRWKSGKHPYALDANDLIDAMVQTEAHNGGIVDNVQDPFDVELGLPRRTSSASEGPDVQADYLMPAFYAYWAGFRPQDASFWQRAADASRELLRLVPVPNNGLVPALVDVNGRPAQGIDYYDEVAARTLLNRWFCQAFMGPQPWLPEQNGRLLDFFLEQGNYVSSYFLDGRVRGARNTTAHLALLATAAAFTNQSDKHKRFLQALVSEPVPQGEGRYYDGMLYLLSLLAVSGTISR